jgi:uncharacterized protein YkwD
MLSALAPAVAAAACPVGALPARFDRAIPRAGKHDPRLIADAVLIETNRARCARGLRPLRTDLSLQKAAYWHSGDMARKGFFSHSSPVRGRRTLSDRVGKAGYTYRKVAENIIEAHFMAYRNGARFQVVDASRCKFRYSSGAEIPAHSYGSLATELVSRWMNSPGHRQNILTPDLQDHGFALAANGETALCGGLYATQVLAR